MVNPLTVRDFSKVILTLDNVLVQSEKLSETPSMQDGLDFETETDLRILGCELIQTSGILLKLPQVSHGGHFVFQMFETLLLIIDNFMYNLVMLIFENVCFCCRSLWLLVKFSSNDFIIRNHS